MAEASNKTKYIRRLKRDIKKALAIAEVALHQRDQARIEATAIRFELERLQDKAKNKVTITPIVEEPSASSDEAVGQGS